MRYEINLPPGTKEEVIEWFEFMNGQNILVDQVIKLVNQNISHQHTEAESFGNLPKTSMEPDCLMDNLFNCFRNRNPDRTAPAACTAVRAAFH